MEQSALSSCQSTPPGSGSFRVTPYAVPTPLFDTTIVNAAVSPALIVPWSAVFTTETSGQLTVIVTGPADGLPSLEVSALTELLTTPQVADVVGDEMCTVLDAPLAMSSNEHERTPALIEHWAAPVPPSMDQDRPASVGKVSLRATSLAVPAASF